MMKVVNGKNGDYLAGITADQISHLLARKHEQDIFVPECKNGETYGARDLLMLDAWVLRRTYSPLTTIGYEIKVSRADFEQDQKWTRYLPLCHEFYFVCPAGLIRAVDLPSQVGLIWVSQTGNLHIKRRAEYCTPDTEKLRGLLIYVLMSRSIIARDMYEANRGLPPPEEDRVEDMHKYLAEVEEKKMLAHMVRGHIRREHERLNELERGILQREESVKRFARSLGKLGITWNTQDGSWSHSYEVDNKIQVLKKTITWEMLSNMEHAAEMLAKVAKQIREVEADEKV
jgi:hypothetical protein